jgi:gamma-glutamylcyclotransferase (GGCT)/AIG2-like uncharacterized protein YtfP
MQHNLFAYGTLMVRQIMHSVSGVDLAGVPCRLPGYQRRLLRGEVYPGIRPNKQASVEGILYTRLGRQAWQRLDRFEGEMYCRETVEVELPNRQSAQAQAYVLKPAYYKLLSATPWTLEQFLHSGMSPFVAEYRGFDQLRDSTG